MRFQIQKSGGRGTAVQPELEEVGDGVVIASARRLAAGGRTQERFQVIATRDGKIVDMQGCTSRRRAERFARRQAAAGGA